MIKLIIVTLLAMLPVAGQTAAELLQKGIYVQETEGNLDNAILIYRQIVNSAPAERDVAAQAQYRLAQALLQKGDLASASKEFEKLARDYADYQKLVSDLAAQAGGRGGRGGRGQGPTAFDRVEQARLALDKLAQSLKAAEQARLAQLNSSLNPDLTKPITIQGKVSIVLWVNPMSYLYIQQDNGAFWGFKLQPPDAIVRLGWTRASLKLGDIVTVTGYASKDDVKGDCPSGPNMQNLCANASMGVAASVVRSDGTILPLSDPNAH